MNEAPAKRKIWKRILRYVFSVVLIAAVLLGIAFAYLYTNQEQLRGALVEEVNKHLDAELKVKDIRMDFFSQFPDVSFRFTEVFCKEMLPTTSSDTLFYFQDVYFEFNLWQLVQAEYELKGITFDQGVVKIKMYRNGRDNFHFWKESTDTTDSKLKIDLEDVELSSTRVFFSDITADVATQMYAKRLSLSGGLNSGSFSSTAEWKGNISYLNVEDINYLPERSVYAKLNFRTTGDSTFIEDGNLEIDGLAVSAAGHIVDGENHWELSGSQLSLARFIEVLPKPFLPDPSLVEADGLFDLNMRIDLKDKKALIVADTELKNARLALKKSGLELSQLAFQAHFDNGTLGRLQDSRLNVANIAAKTRTGNLKAELSIANFASPTITTKGDLNVSFEEALTLAGTDFWELAEGQLSGSFYIRKRYPTIADIQASGLTGAVLTGEMTLSDGRLKVTDTGLDMEGLSTSMSFADGDIELKNLQFNSGSSDFRANGIIKKALVFGQTPMPTFRLDVHSDRLNLEDIFAWELDHREGSETDEPFRFDFNVRLSVNQFQHRSFTAQKVNGQVYSQGMDIVGNDLTFVAVGGNITTNFRWHPDGSVYELTTRGALRNVDINRLFTEFDNFGQKSLTADNISGRADVDYAVKIYFNEEMEPVLESLVSETDFKIREGRLVNYAPMEKLSRFAEISELRNVQFATLENHLSINDQNIHIPGMTVKSSVLELWVEGDHNFQNDIDYSLKIQLLDALGSRRNTSDELADFIQETNREQPLIPVRIYGTLDDPSISLDRSLLGDGLQEEWKNEGQELRDLWEGKEDPTESEPQYIFEWEEDTTGRG